MTNRVMAVQKIRWYVKAQLGVLLLPAGLCVFGEAVIRKGIQTWSQLAANSDAGRYACVAASASAAIVVLKK